MGIYVEWCGAPQQTECRYEANEPETVVAVQVRYEYVVYEREMNVVAAQLQLCTFATVYHKEFVACSYNL